MIEIIPAIDIIEGSCVRLTKGDYSSKKIYHADPLEVARRFEDAGLKRLHLVDLDGAKAGKVVNTDVLQKLSAFTKLHIDFGGGIKANEDIQAVFDAGASAATIGSVAVKDPELFFGWVKRFGADKILLGADARDEKIAISGWLEETAIGVFDFIGQNLQRGVRNVLCTDISRDGMLQGTAVELYRKIIQRFPAVSLTASGGVSSIEDIMVLEEAGCKAVVIGKAIYEGRIRLNELARFAC